MKHTSRAYLLAFITWSKGILLSYAEPVADSMLKDGKSPTFLGGPIL